MTSCVSFVDLNINNAEQFKESLSEPADTKLYLSFGKTDSWANDSLPAQANTSVSTIYEVWSNMIGGKRLVGSDVQHVIPRYNWTTGTVYTEYDNTVDDLYGSSFYVVTTDYNVYKCISNNYGETSTVQPTSVNPAIVSATSDGYLWKYMFTISDADQLRFMTTNYIPIKTLTLSDDSLQWQVQNTATVGTIDNIKVVNGGTGYSNAANITISVSGDGSGLTGIATINSSSNSVNSISVSGPGAGYTYANVTITSTDSGAANATARAIISPPGGHGSNPLYELGGRNIMINGRFQYSENGVLPISNDFRQISIIKDPFLNGTTEIASNSAFLQAMTITAVGSGNYIQDEWVYQGGSFETSVFKGRVISWDASTSKLLLINILGTPTAAQSLIGATSFTVRAISSVMEETFEKYSGRLLYVDNIEPITRDSEQIEDFKILVRF